MKASQDMEALFQAAREQTPMITLEEVQQRFVQELAAGKPGASLRSLLTKSIVMITTVGAIVVAAWLGTSNTTSQVQPEKQEHIEVNVQPVESAERQEAQERVKFNIVESAPKVVKESNTIDRPDTRELPQAPDKRISTPIETKVLPAPAEPAIQMQDNGYRFPNLTPEEKADNEIQKQKMLKQLGKLDKDKYVPIPMAAKQSDNGNVVQIKQFYMQTTEVSNLEYRTFLFDLLIQGRNEVFLKAKPDQARWADLVEANKMSEKESALFTDLYFSHPAYNGFPVVNISREAAQMYCRWLAEECAKVAPDRWDWKKMGLTEMRLPTDKEWKHAAKGGHSYAKYPWGGPSTKNAKGCYLMNYSPEGDAPEADATKFMAQVDTYVINDYGLYNCSGNVAEMVWVGTTAGTCGGSWSSRENEVEIDGEDPHRGVVTSSPLIGFRPVIPIP